MTRTSPTPDPERPGLTPDDARLVARVRDGFAPAPMSGAERTRFDAAVQERVERARRRRLGAWPALGAGLVAASLAALFVVGQPPAPIDAPPRVAETPAPTAPTRLASAWAGDLLYGEVGYEDERVEDDDALPAEYAAIAGMLLDY